MAKLFYSVAETAEKLGKSEDEIRAMATSGQLEEFREGDDLVFKSEQVELLASANEDIDDEISLDLGDGIDLADSGLGASSMIGLADSEIDLGESALDLTDSGGGDNEAIALDGGGDEPAAEAPAEASGAVGLDGSGVDLSGLDGGGLDAGDDIALGGSSISPDLSGMGADAMSSGVPLDDDLGGLGGDESAAGDDAADQTGISIFADDDGVADASADTFVGDGGGMAGFDLSADQLETVGSGSGLMDLTREGDDTSLGVDLLDDAYGGGADASGMDVTAAAGETLFESSGDGMDAELAAPAGMAAASPVIFDGPGSGAVLGLSIGVALTMLFIGAVVVLDAVGVGSGLIFGLIEGMWWLPVAVLAGVTAVGAGVGLVLMKKS